MTIKSKRVEAIIEELKDQYLEEDRYTRPWIIGFSGGKDSTVLLTLYCLLSSGLHCKDYVRKGSL